MCTLLIRRLFLDGIQSSRRQVFCRFQLVREMAIAMLRRGIRRIHGIVFEKALFFTLIFRSLRVLFFRFT